MDFMLLHRCTSLHLQTGFLVPHLGLFVVSFALLWAFRKAMSAAPHCRRRCACWPQGLGVGLCTHGQSECCNRMKSIGCATHSDSRSAAICPFCEAFCADSPVACSKRIASEQQPREIASHCNHHNPKPWLLCSSRTHTTTTIHATDCTMKLKFDGQICANPLLIPKNLHVPTKCGMSFSMTVRIVALDRPKTKWKK